MAIRGVMLRDKTIEFTFSEIDYDRVNKWLALCDTLDSLAEKRSEKRNVEITRNFLLDVDFQSNEPYRPSSNKNETSAVYDMEQFNETVKAELNDALYYLAGLAGDMRLDVEARKSADGLYKFMEYSFFTRTMDAFVETDRNNMPVDYVEGEEFATKLRKNAPEKKTEEERMAEESEMLYNSEIAF